MNIEKTPRQSIREAVKQAIEPLEGSLVLKILDQYDAAIDAAETPFIRIITLSEAVERLNMEEDQRSLQLAIQSTCIATHDALNTLETVALAIERQMVDDGKFAVFTEHLIDDIQLIETQFPELDDQPTVYVALVYQVSYTTQRGL